MAERDDDRIEFLDPLTPAPSQDEALPGAAPPGRLALIVIVALVATVVVVLAVSHARPHPSAAASETASGQTSNFASRAALPPPEPIPPDPTPTASPTSYPLAPIRRVAVAVCGSAAPCATHPGSTRASRAARRALGPVRDLQIRTIGSGRALIVAALRRDGALLLAVVTRPGVRVNPTRLGITPPIAVQSQANGTDRLVVVVSGTIDAVALLGSPRVQRWLAGLSAG